MIRKATEEDLPIILNMCRTFWKETRYTEEFDPDHTLAMIEMALDHGLLAVVEGNSEILGFCAAVKSPLLASREAWMATELAWWINPEHRTNGHGLELLAAMENLARDEGVKYFNVVSMQSSNPESANKLYIKTGYTLNEIVFTKELT